MQTLTLTFEALKPETRPSLLSCYLNYLANVLPAALILSVVVVVCTHFYPLLRESKLHSFSSVLRCSHLSPDLVLLLEGSELAFKSCIYLRCIQFHVD